MDDHCRQAAKNGPAKGIRGKIPEEPNSASVPEVVSRADGTAAAGKAKNDIGTKKMGETTCR